MSLLSPAADGTVALNGTTIYMAHMMEHPLGLLHSLFMGMIYVYKVDNVLLFVTA